MISINSRCFVQWEASYPFGTPWGIIFKARRRMQILTYSTESISKNKIKLRLCSCLEKHQNILEKKEEPVIVIEAGA